MSTAASFNLAPSRNTFYLETLKRSVNVKDYLTHLLAIIWLSDAVGDDGDGDHDDNADKKVKNLSCWKSCTTTTEKELGRGGMNVAHRARCRRDRTSALNRCFAIERNE